MLAAVALSMLAGCQYEYDLTQPADLAGHIGSKWTNFTLGPVQYRMTTVDSRLVIEAFNPGPDSIQLLGDQSTVVDPDGQAHLIHAQLIVPQSFAKLILPPLRPDSEPHGPIFELGFGAYTNLDEVRQRPLNPTPQYLDLADDSSPYYWDWKGETDVRLTLTFQRGTETVRHQFTFHRREK